MQVANPMEKHDNDSSVVVKRLSVPLGLEELMESLTKQVLQKKPRDIYSFASEHFAKLLDLRENSSAKLHRDSSNLTTPPKAITLSDSQANILSHKSAIFATAPSRLRLRNKCAKEHEVYDKVGVDQKIDSSTVQYSQARQKRMVPSAVPTAPSTLGGPTTVIRRQDNQLQKERQQQQGRKARAARAAVDGRRHKGWEGQAQSSDEVPIQAPVRRSSTERRKQYDKDLHNLRLRRTQIHSSEESIAKSDNSDSNHQHVKQKPPDVTNNNRKSRVRPHRGTAIRRTESFEVLEDNICIDGNNISLVKSGLPKKAKGSAAKIVAGAALMLDKVQESKSDKVTNEDNIKSNIDDNHPSAETTSNVTDIDSQGVKALEDYSDTSTDIAQENFRDNIDPTLIDTFETLLTIAEKTTEHMKDEIVEQQNEMNQTIANEIEVFNETSSNCIDTSNNLIDAATAIVDKANNSFDEIVLLEQEVINENVIISLAQEVIKDVAIKDSDVTKKMADDTKKLFEDFVSTEPAFKIIEVQDGNVNEYSNIQVPLLSGISNVDTIGIDEIDKIDKTNISSDLESDIKDSAEIKNDVVTTTEETNVMESQSPRDKPTALVDISSIPVALLKPDQISPRNEKNESNVPLVTATVVNSAKNIISGSLAAVDEEIAKVLLEFNEMQATWNFLNKEVVHYKSEKSDVEYRYIPLRDYSLESEDNSNEREMQSGENLEDGNKEVVIEIDTNINSVEESAGQEIKNELIQSNEENVEKILHGNKDDNIKSFVTEDINTTGKIIEIAEKLNVDQTAKDTFFGKEVSPRAAHEECLVSKSNRAAIQIQSAWRGHRTRKTLARKHLQRTEECDELPEYKLGAEDVLRAATTIQAFLRGHLVRKALRQGNVSVIDSPEKCHILEEILEEPEVEIMAENDQKIVKLTDKAVEEALKQLDAIKGPKQFDSGTKSSNDSDDINHSKNKFEVVNDGIDIILAEDSVIVQNQDLSENTLSYKNNTEIKPIKESLNTSDVTIDSDNISLLSADSPSKDEKTLHYEMAPTRPLTSENTEPIVSKLDSQLLRKGLEIVESTNEEASEDLKLPIPDSRNVEIHDSTLDVSVKDDELTNTSYEEDVSTESQESLSTVIMVKDTFESVTPESDISNTLDEIDDSVMDVKESFNDLLQNDNSISPVTMDINEKLSRYHDLNIRHDVENSEFIEEMSTVNIDYSELEQNLKNALEYDNNNTIIIQTENSPRIPEEKNIKILTDIISAATKIQSLYRGYKVRAKTYTKPNGKANIGIIIEGPENNNNAAVEDKNKIYDDVIAKIEAEQYEELHKISGKATDTAVTRQAIVDSIEEVAATTIQKHYKGHRVRRDLANQLAENTGKDSSVKNVESVIAQDEAATNVVNSENKILRNDVEENAALVNQKRYKGFKTRRYLADKSKEIEDKLTLELSQNKIEDATNIVKSENKILQKDEEENAALVIQKHYKGFKARRDLAKQSEVVEDKDVLVQSQKKVENTTLGVLIDNKISQIIEDDKAALPIQEQDNDYKIRNVETTENVVECDTSDVNEELPQLDSISNCNMKELISNSTLRNDENKSENPSIQQFIDSIIETNALDMPIQHSAIEELNNTEKFIETSEPIIVHSYEKRYNDKSSVVIEEIIEDDHDGTQVKIGVEINAGKPITREDKVKTKGKNVQSSKDTTDSFKGGNIANFDHDGRTKVDRLNTVVEDDIVKEAKYILGKKDDENINSTDKKDLEQRINDDVRNDFESNQDSKNVSNYLSNIENNSEKTNELNIDLTAQVEFQKVYNEGDVEEESSVDGPNNSGKNVKKTFDINDLRKEILEAGNIQIVNDDRKLEVASVQDQVPQNEHHNKYNAVVQNKENTSDTEDIADITPRCEHIVHDTEESKKDKTNKLSKEEIEVNYKQDEVVRNIEIVEANTILGQDKEAKINEEGRTESSSTLEIEENIQPHKDNSAQGKFENEKKENRDIALTTSLSQNDNQIDDKKLRDYERTNDINNGNIPDQQEMNKDSAKNEISVKEIEDRKDSNIENSKQLRKSDGDKESKECQNDFDENILNVNNKGVDKNASANLMELQHTENEQKNISNNAKESAAIAIQKHYKGYKVRKGLSVQNDLKPDLQLKKETEVTIISSTHQDYTTKDELFINNQSKSMDDLQFNNEDGDKYKLNIGIGDLQDAKISFAEGLKEMLNDQTHNSTDDKNDNVETMKEKSEIYSSEILKIQDNGTSINIPNANTDNTGLNEEANLRSILQESKTEQKPHDNIDVDNDQMLSTMELSSLVQNNEANGSTTSNIGNENHETVVENVVTQSSTSDKNKQEESEEIVIDFEIDATKDFDENRRSESLSDDLNKIVNINNDISQESKEFIFENAIQAQKDPINESDISKEITITIAKNDENIDTISSNEKEDDSRNSDGRTLEKEIVMKAKNVHVANKPNKESILDVEDAKGTACENATVTAQLDENKSQNKNEDNFKVHEVHEIDSQIDIIEHRNILLPSINCTKCQSETNVDKSMDDSESKNGSSKDDEVINSSPNNENDVVNLGTEISDEKPTNEDTDQLRISEDIIATQNASSQQNPEIHLEDNVAKNEIDVLATANILPQDDITNKVKDDYEEIIDLGDKAAPIESNQIDKEIQEEKPTTVNLKATRKIREIKVEESIQPELPIKTTERKSNLETTDGEENEQSSIIINEDNSSVQDPIFETKSHLNSFEEDIKPDQDPEVNKKEMKSEVGGTETSESKAILSEISTTHPLNDVLQSFSVEQQETFAQLKSKSEEIETQLRNSLREIETFTKEQLEEPFYLHDPKSTNTTSTAQNNPIARVVQIAAGTTHTTAANIELLQTAAASKANCDAIVKVQEASVSKPLYVNVDSLGDFTGPVFGVVNPEDIKDGRLPVTLQLCPDGIAGDIDGPPAGTASVTSPKATENRAPSTATN